MRLLEGKIGLQEGACILASALVGLSVFTLRGAYAYEKGNASYIWLPASVAFALLGALAAAAMLRKRGYCDLTEFYTGALGKFAGGAALLLLAWVLLHALFQLQSTFVDALHSYIFPESAYRSVVFWVMAGVLYTAWGGLERIGRSAKCVAAPAALLFLVSLLIPMKRYALYRLFPFPGEAPLESAHKMLLSSAGALAVLLSGLVFSGALQGTGCAKKGLGIAVGCATPLIFAVQFTLALVFTSEQLASFYLPLFRLDTTLLEGSYYMQPDKLVLFLCFCGLLPAMAYLLYAAAVLLCRSTGLRDLHPALLSLFSCLFFAQIWKESGFYPLLRNLAQWMERNTLWLVYAPLLLALLAAWLRGGRKGGKQYES